MTKGPKVGTERFVRLARTFCIAFFPYTAVRSSPTAVTETLKLVVAYLWNNNRTSTPVIQQPETESLISRNDTRSITGYFQRVSNRFYRARYSQSPT